MNTEALKKLEQECTECIEAWKKEKGGTLPYEYYDHLEHCRIYGGSIIEELYQEAWEDEPDVDDPEAAPEMQAALRQLERRLMAVNYGEEIGERKYIGYRINQLRNDKGMTQQELADKTGIKREHVSRIEAGKYSVGLDILTKIAKAFGTNIDFI